MASNIVNNGSDDCFFGLGRLRWCRWRRQDARESRPRLEVVADFEEVSLGYRQIRGQGNCEGKKKHVSQVRIRYC